MVSIEPKITPGARYTPYETASLLGISRSTLDRLTRAGALMAGRHKANGRRYYTGREIVSFWRSSL